MSLAVVGVITNNHSCYQFAFFVVGDNTNNGG
jgi:hypothetical protein